MKNDLLLKVLDGEKVERPPIWLMRQAGRYMKEYRDVRSKVTFLELCKTPELACEVTLQPIRAFGLDAAIVFSDILIPIEPMGVELDFNPAPVIANPIRSKTDAEKLTLVDPYKDLNFVIETVKLLVSKLDVPLIGFSGAPFTLACYMVEGKGSKNFDVIKTFMRNDEDGYRILMEKLSDSTIKYLQAQIDNGCPVVQIFDTWAGVLSPYDYEKYVFPYVDYIINNLKNAKVIYFAKNGATFFNSLKKLKCDALGVDWSVNLEDYAKLTDDEFVLQGNMDPTLLFASQDKIREMTKTIINEGKNIKGHIFNLGHGILPQTPVENVEFLVKFVKGEVE
ncbi:uroporphyrinogen decarboxylase [Deferribacter desulfuricans SSM1]|uniref:Uroporphyrinogen decarboxylase n=1 Tax=Deferribacter desulfuricans (strain DSM 14783 / JCM 11476 / NBRC 101012 / SSM1) TaxID=639282 RepID=D3PB46_DEFDS|nr:uroporphyrinogen decarboxylase [Deferribacter desulfuricans]BAI79819.1 uroporphyrinogen decarboxylase [Deferribacter desulfuricans SSM1]